MGMQEQMNNLERSMGRVEGKLDVVMAHLEKMNGALVSHNKRIDKLEQESAKAKGIAVGTSMVVSFLASVVNLFIKDK